MDEKKNNQIKKTNEIVMPATGNEVVNPSEIEGKIEIKDTRERQDGPGGN